MNDIDIPGYSHRNPVASHQMSAKIDVDKTKRAYRMHARVVVRWVRRHIGLAKSKKRSKGLLIMRMGWEEERKREVVGFLMRERQCCRHPIRSEAESHG